MYKNKGISIAYFYLLLDSAYVKYKLQTAKWKSEQYVRLCLKKIVACSELCLLRYIAGCVRTYGNYHEM
jgi:hypothetical protein